MKFNISNFSQFFLLLSVVYLIIVDFDINFLYLIIFISSIVFTNEIIRISSRMNFLKYRSKNYNSSVLKCFVYIISKIYIPYLIFIIFIIINSSNAMPVIYIIALFFSLINICLFMSILCSYLSLNLYKESKMMLICFIILSLNYLALFAFGPQLGYASSIVSIFDFSDIKMVIFKFIIILGFIIKPILKVRYKNNYE